MVAEWVKNEVYERLKGWIGKPMAAIELLKLQDEVNCIIKDLPFPVTDDAGHIIKGINLERGNDKRIVVRYIR